MAFRNKAADAYRDKAIAYAKMAGEAKNIPHHLSDGTENPDWTHWTDYFRHIGMKGSVEQMGRNGTDFWTVPTKSPLHFDEDVALRAIEAGDRHRHAVSEARRTLTKERRAEIVKRVVVHAKAGFKPLPKTPADHIPPPPPVARPHSAGVAATLTEWDRIAIEARKRTYAGSPAEETFE